MMRIVALVCMLLFSSAAALAAPVTLKLGHIGEPQHPYGLGAEYFAKLVKERSNGSIDVQVFPSGLLGDQHDLVEGLTLDSIDMALAGSDEVAIFLPELAIFNLPYLFRDVQHAYKALDSIGMELCKKGEERGFVTLAIWENGINHLTNNVRPIVTPADIRGLKIRVMEVPLCIATMQALGGNPAPMPMSTGEMFVTLLKRGVDGQECSLAHIVTKRFFEVQKFLSLTGHTYDPELLLISSIAWKKLTQEQQALIRQAAEDARDWQRNMCRVLGKSQGQRHVCGQRQC